MRFSLQDIKKSVRRHQGELTVSLHFLQQGELANEIAQLIVYYEHLLGQPQHLFSLDTARACIGDYRLAHCLIATLSHWYTWRQREWTEAVQGLSGQTDLADMTSPIQLRLALYTYVNEHYHGFLDAQTRNEALQTFAETHALTVRELEYLLVMDGDAEAQLVRASPTPPTAQEVATLYNQWVFEAALFNASRVRFLIDCNAFSKNQLTPSTGVGAVIKRLCYLARKMGVYYDMTYEQALPGMPILLALTLYGPQEVTGAAQHYGQRLARLCRILMGYGIASSESARKVKRPSLANTIVEAAATVHFLQRSYAFRMDATLLYLLPAVERDDGLEKNKDTYEQTEDAQIFDSSIEQLFAEAFTALALSQGVDGWRLEREPEPLVLAQSILIPDFALTRAQRRIYVEILGFWTPTYRERKLHKLLQLQERDDLVLAIPVEAKDAFSSILAAFPIVLYDGQLSATDVLFVLRKHYDDFAERLAQIDVAAVRTRIRHDGLLTERICADMLHCYRRSELQCAVEYVLTEEIVFSIGIGLYTRLWMERVKQSFITWMCNKHSVVLMDALQEIRRYGGTLQACEDETLEAMIGMWSEVQVRRDSIFDAIVELANRKQLGEEAQDQSIAASISEKSIKPREKRNTMRKQVKSAGLHTTQGDLWG
ncbi:MAG: hypothetical protein NVSMB38_23640 [Ktedonobacteraceae bacterium]